jgi:hypothetical protein
MRSGHPSARDSKAIAAAKEIGQYALISDALAQMGSTKGPRGLVLENPGWRLAAADGDDLAHIHLGHDGIFASGSSLNI